MSANAPVAVFDSTLRDGAQGEGISYSVQDKLGILSALDEFGVDYIEAGNPGSNPKDAAFFNAASKRPLKNAKLTAFGATRRKFVPADEDPQLACLVSAGTPAAAVFGKAHRLHAERVLSVPPDENLAMVADSVAYLKKRHREVIFDAEHFFDGAAYDLEYALSVVRAAAAAGADYVTLCDTNGGALPDRIAELTKLVRKTFPTLALGIHTHDDAGLAAACALSAVDAGCTMVQGTFTGIGERCGNCDLSILVPDLVLKRGIPCGLTRPVKLSSLMETARRISDISNVVTRPNKPYTGKSAFAHKGGMHIDAMEKLPGAYEHIDPSAVGNERRFLVSEVAGRSTIVEKLRSIEPGLERDSSETKLIMDWLKRMEKDGYSFEAADASFQLATKKLLHGYKPHFKVILYKSTDDFPYANGEMRSAAMIHIEVDGRTETTASLGNGPVNALDLALRKALTVFYPILSEVTLTDFKVRVIEANSTTAAKVRVLIESTDSRNVWTTVGVSDDIIEASFNALCDSIEYKLSMSEPDPSASCGDEKPD